MESLVINVRVDANDKRRFESFCSDVGLNVSTAVNLFIKTVLKENKIPFEISTKTSEEYIAEKLREAEEEMERVKKRYSVSELVTDLNKAIDE